MSDRQQDSTATGHLERLSALDASFLHLERDVQQLHVGSALVFEGPAPTYADLCSAIDARLPLVPRYRQRVRRVPLDLGRPVWSDDGRFDVRHHVRHTTVRAPGSDRALRTLAARLMSDGLDLTLPLWEMWLVTGLADGRWALVNKGHHAMMDGISGSDIMGVLLDREPDASAPPTTSWQAAAEPSSLGLVASSVAEALGHPVDLARASMHAVRRPRDLVVLGATQAYGLARLGVKVAQPESVLDGSLGSQRRWAWSRADLEDVKTVKNRFGGTVNDVVLAAISGGFRTFLQARDEEVDGRTVRSMVPVSTRGPAEQGTAGNHVSAVFADLPVGVEDAVDRLTSVSAQLSGLKRSGMAQGVDAMLAASGFLPPTLFALGTRVAAHLPQRTISTVTTNVPGPQWPLYLQGRRMLEMYPYIPLASQVRITIGIMSYDGQVTFGVTGDHDAVPDLEVLASGISAAMAELVALAAD